MKYRGFQISWWLVLAEFALIFGVSLFYEQIKQLLGIPDSVIEILIQLLTLIPVVIGLGSLKRLYPYTKCRELLGIRGFDITMLLFFAVMPFAIQFFATYAAFFANAGLIGLFGEYDPGVTYPTTLWEFAFLLLSACIAAPVLEELLFRGVMMKLLEPYGFLTAAIVSAISFSMLHLQPTGFIIMAFIGFVLAYVRYVSGSVLACMVLHAFSNFYSVINIVFEKEIMRFETEYMIFSVILAVLFPVMILIYKKVYPQCEKYIPTAKRLGFSVGLFVCVCIYIGSCISMLLPR